MNLQQQTDNIRQAILRYGLEHPVINDSEFRVWNEYTVRAWPTLVLIDSRGKIRVEAWIEERELVLRVSDQGLGFDAATVVARKLGDAQQSGLARALALSEDLHLDSETGSGTRATARFTASRVDFEEDDAIDLSELDFFTPDLARRVLHALKKDETASLYRFSPALAVVVGRLLSGDEIRRAALARAES